ncbi:MAG: T9SS type A sorting domain-containing protein, partial [Bacteroidales bacterium]|nr:T9SS type A sorting domain-containing protein [Bacteroidales bacterium]
ITVSAAGGTPVYTGTGDYTVTAGTQNYTVTDANGCTANTSITVSEPTLLTASSSSTAILCNGGNSTITVSAAGGTPVYTGTGDYTVTAGTQNYTVTDANGCTANTSITVTEPAAIVSSQVLSLCAGESITVGTSVYSTTGIFTDILTTLNGCDSTVTTNLTVFDAIDVSASVSAGTISATLSGADYQWIDCNTNIPISGANGQSYTPTSDGNYAVIVAIGNCSDTSDCFLITKIATEKNNFYTIKIYPNPVSEYLIISLGVENSEMNITISDINGKELKVLNKINSDEVLVNMKDICPGAYFVRLQNNNMSKVVKFMKN